MAIIASTLVTFCTTIVALMIGVRLNFDRANKEKIWDLRRQAYGVVLARLDELEVVCDQADEEISQCGDSEYFYSSSYKRDRALCVDRLKQIGKRISEDYLIVSDDFLELYRQFTADLESTHDDAPPDEYARFEATVRKFRPLMLAHARRETNEKLFDPLELLMKPWAKR